MVILCRLNPLFSIRRGLSIQVVNFVFCRKSRSNETLVLEKNVVDPIY